MAIVLISYDIHPRGSETHEKVATAIRTLGAWWHHLETTWIIECDRTPDEIRDALKVHIGSADQLLIVRVPRCAASWFGISDSGCRWLEEHLGKAKAD